MFRVTLLVVATTTLAVASDLDWWQTALIYQIYPRSYMDSNADGIGDLNGITSKLPYLSDLGVDAIWMSPIYLSPMYDFGYDITDYREIATEYGTMDDFDNLMSVAKNLSIKVVLDFVPNHTGNESQWFSNSANRTGGYDDWYVWADGINNTDGTVSPPSNWISNFRGSAWQWHETRQQYYLHQFVIGQPDLNYRSSEVQTEMQNVLRFWLDKGVSGFRVDAVNMLYEVDADDYGGVYPDEPVSGLTTDEEDYTYLTHIYTKDLNETYTVVYDWRDVLDEYIATQGEYKIMMTEAYTDIDLMLRYYGDGSRNGSIPFNFSFMGEITKTSNAKDVKIVIDKWMTYMPSGKTANWVNGNHDNSRLATRLGADRVDGMNMLALLLPGVAVTYQGEEIGMTDGEVTWEETVDPQACNTNDSVNYYLKSRDPCRTPYQWDASANAGFSTTTNKTWLPVASNYLTLNLANEMSANKSHYHFYKDVVVARKTAAAKTGDLETRALSENVIAVVRLLPGEQAIVGIVNFGANTEVVDLSTFLLLPSDLQVIASGVDCDLVKGASVTKTSVSLSAHGAVVLRSTNNVVVDPGSCTGKAHSNQSIWYLYIAIIASVLVLLRR